MKLDLFPNFEKLHDAANPFCDVFKTLDGDIFYIEPVFYTYLEGFKALRSEEFEKIINRILEIVKKNHKVVFTGNFEDPMTIIDGFIYLEINDITDPLKIYVEDKSRGSDYGD